MVTTEGRTFATTAGTERVLSVEATAPLPGLAKAEELVTRLQRAMVAAIERSGHVVVRRAIGLIFRFGLILAQLSRKEKPWRKRTG
jgi:hypothetical protein